MRWHLRFVQAVAVADVEEAYFAEEPGKLKQNDKTAID
jgi:hypothetical protein